MARICANKNCNNSLEDKKQGAIYCSPKCKAENHRRNKSLGLGGIPMQQPSFPMQMQQSGDANSFILKQRIDELSQEKKEAIAEIKELQKKNEQLRDELATIKTDHAIFKVENQKEEVSTLGSIMGAINENPSMLPQIIQSIPALLQGLSSMGGNSAQGNIPQVADPELQMQLAEFSKWFIGLEPELRLKVWEMIEAISQMEPETQKFHINNIISAQNGTRQTGTY